MAKNIKQKILIVDDSEMNRAILSEILGNEYEIIEAENGEQAIAVLQKMSMEITLVLLDIVMPIMDGYEVLAVMNNRHWIGDVPVIMISAESSPASIERAYELGVTDFISRPFDAAIVRRRIVNTLLLYAKQRKLVELAADQIFEKEKTSNMMTSILSHIVEFRNGESGQHVLHVQTLTEILLRRLVQITDAYKLSKADITMISNASALHDIGKISIADEILNKPGRLTDEEFAIMKTHSMVGASMLDEMPFYKDEPLVKVAYEICRWHHERYDGRGYPDGLKGDEIPISAQIVALADVYDALTSERVYKKAYTHDVAMNMILNGECGVFNPVLLECLKDSAETIKSELGGEGGAVNEMEMKGIVDEILQHEELSSSEETLRMLNYERERNSFLSDTAEEIYFEYMVQTDMLTLNKYGTNTLGLKECTINPFADDKIVGGIHKDDMAALKEAINKSPRENPDVQRVCRLNIGNDVCEMKVVCRVIWSGDESPQRIGIIGKCTK